MPHRRLCHARIRRPGDRPLHRLLLSDRGICIKLGGLEQLSSEQHHRVSAIKAVNRQADELRSQWKRAVTAVS